MLREYEIPKDVKTLIDVDVTQKKYLTSVIIQGLLNFFCLFFILALICSSQVMSRHIFSCVYHGSQNWYERGSISNLHWSEQIMIHSIYK